MMGKEMIRREVSRGEDNQNLCMKTLKENQLTWYANLKNKKLSCSQFSKVTRV